MRVRITKHPPASYGVDGDSLRIGRIYNLDSSLASALLADNCAELYDTLSVSEKREREDSSRNHVWQAHDRPERKRRRRLLSGFVGPEPAT